MCTCKKIVDASTFLVVEKAWCLNGLPKMHLQSLLSFVVVNVVGIISLYLISEHDEDDDILQHA